MERLGHTLITVDPNDRKAKLDLVTTDKEWNVIDPSLLESTVGWIRHAVSNGGAERHEKHS